MKKSKTLTVDDASYVSCRIDNFVHEKCDYLSREHVKRKISAGDIRLNDQIVKASKSLHVGDVITVTYDIPDVTEPVFIKIIFEDENMIIIDKPAHMSCHPSSRHLTYNVLAQMKSAYPQSNFRLLHRLDRETSGLLMLSKHKTIHQRVSRLFEERKIYKEYRALTYGKIQKSNGSIVKMIVDDTSSEIRIKKTTVDDGVGATPRGCPITNYELIRYIGDFSLLKIIPKTGKQHQIRVHLASIGYPIVGDKIYGLNERFFLDYVEDRGTMHCVPTSDDLIFDRHALHASRIAFTHPMTGESIDIDINPDNSLMWLPAGTEDMLKNRLNSNK